MIEYRAGDLLKADAEALVNTVNTVGVMGKGIALQFKQAYPENYKAYEQVCSAGELQPGGIFTFERGRMHDDKPWFILNVATKKHWRSKSRLDDIRAGAANIADEVRRLGIQSVAIPPLGCGNGGLNWNDVRPLIQQAMQPLQDVKVLVYEPKGAPQPETMKVRTRRPKVTRGRALVLKLIDLYRSPEYRLGKLEVQKLGYLLQEAGEPLRLNYVKHRFGPYADNMNHVLQRIEGHFIRGYGDRSGRAQIGLMPGAMKEAEVVLEQLRDAQSRLERVRRLIDGFETPYGMELLGTVLWLAREDAEVRSDPEAAVRGTQDWNARKRRIFQPEHIKVAWRRLKEEGWFDVHQEETPLLPSG